jgi:hypothetical protein
MLPPSSSIDTKDKGSTSSQNITKPYIANSISTHIANWLPLREWMYILLLVEDQGLAGPHPMNPTKYLRDIMLGN